MLIMIGTHVGGDAVARHAVLADLDGLVHAEAESRHVNAFEWLRQRMKGVGLQSVDRIRFSNGTESTHPSRCAMAYMEISCCMALRMERLGRRLRRETSKCKYNKRQSKQDPQTRVDCRFHVFDVCCIKERTPWRDRNGNRSCRLEEGEQTRIDNLVRDNHSIKAVGVEFERIRV